MELCYKEQLTFVPHLFIYISVDSDIYFYFTGYNSLLSFCSSDLDIWRSFRLALCPFDMLSSVFEYFIIL